jgi:hypothetical protein
LADRFKTWVMSHPQHRRSVMRLAEAAHRFEIGVTRRAEGKEGSAFIGAMTEERSVELASKLVSEGFVFAFGAVLVLAEYERNRRQGLAKQRRDEADRAAAKAKAQEERDVSWGLGLVVGLVWLLVFLFDVRVWGGVG